MFPATPEFFYKHKLTKTRLYPYCKACHNDKSNARIRANPELHSRYCYLVHLRAKVRACELLGNKCNNPVCRWLNEDGTLGCRELRVLTFDHIAGDGYKERQRGTTAYQVLRAPERFQLLCANCHMIKTLEHREVLPRGAAARGVVSKLAATSNLTQG